MRRTDRERSILGAIPTLLERLYPGPVRFDHHPDDTVPSDGQKRRAPDALYVASDARRVMVEISELRRKVPLQYSRVLARRAEAAGDLRPQSYPIHADAATVDETIREYLSETNDKFAYEESADGVLVLDAASYVWGPILIRDLLRGLGLEQWPRITNVWILVDSPFRDSAPNPEGHQVGAYRVWFTN